MEEHLESILNGLRHIARQLEDLKKAHNVWPLQTDDVSKLQEALSKARAEIEPLACNKGNKHTGNYATHSHIMDHIRPTLGKYEISVTQSPHELNGKEGILTYLGHSSGQWRRSFFPLFFREDKSARSFDQKVGSSITYTMRYALCGMLGIQPDKDTDGN